MNLNLTPDQREKVEAAIRKAYGYQDLRHMLRLKMGYMIEEELNIDRGFRFIVSDLVEKAMDGWLDKLLLSALEYRPDSFALQAIIKELGIEPPGKDAGATNPVIDAAEEALLEKTVRKRAPIMDFDDFTKRLSSIGPRICRIEIPEGTAQGTGWLVAPDLILTAYHVVKKVHEKVNGRDAADIFCRFDYTATGAASATERGCGVVLTGGDWLVDYSPYSQADLAPAQGDPAPGELDYALIRLSEKAGEHELPNGAKRGWISIGAQPPVMATNDFVIIPQHPEGAVLQLAFGEILKYNQGATRVQYDTNTEPGSSGSPCFDINLAPFGLHHASGPAKTLHYNQAVPLREIIKLMKSRNVLPFWENK